MNGNCPSQSSIFRGVPTQNVFNFVHYYKMTSSLSDDVQQRTSHLTCIWANTFMT